MQTATMDAWEPWSGVSDRPQTACPPEVLLAMGRGYDRSRVKGALAREGWSVTSVDDGWTLLDHLAGALLSGGVWKPPALLVIESALAGPRLVDLFARVKSLFPALPVLLVGSSPPELAERTFGIEQLLSAIARTMGGLR